VTFTAPAAGEYVFFSSVLLPVALFSLDGTVFPEKSLAMLIQECSQVKVRVSYFLQMGSYVVRLGADPKNAASVDVVVAPTQ
jgi:hypothetical protein